MKIDRWSKCSSPNIVVNDTIASSDSSILFNSNMVITQRGIIAASKDVIAKQPSGHITTVDEPDTAIDPKYYNSVVTKPTTPNTNPIEQVNDMGDMSVGDIVHIKQPPNFDYIGELTALNPDHILLRSAENGAIGKLSNRSVILSVHKGIVFRQDPINPNQQPKSTLEEDDHVQYHVQYHTVKSPIEHIKVDLVLSKECECGTHKVYGHKCASKMHSSWCQLYKGE